MARARNIKPSFFTSEQLADSCPLGRLLFIGLWTEADYQGNLEWKPRTLKVKLLPFDECNIEQLAINLEKSGLVRFYSVRGQKYINIPNFEKHQNPHKNERDKGSDIPEYSENNSQAIDSIELANNPDKNGTDAEIHGTDRADSCFPLTDSPFPLPDSRSPSVAQPSVREPEKPKDETALQAACKETWESYCLAYNIRYKVDPVRNAKVNAQVKQLCKSLPLDEAPRVAEFYVFHNQEFYVRKGHDFGLLVSDATKLRTEWATGQMMTGTRAKQVDRTSSMLDAAEQVKREMGWTA